MNFLERIPNWVRWILFLPLSILALSLVYPLVIILNGIFSIGFLEHTYIGYLFIIILAAGWSAYSFVWVGAKVAPTHQFLVSVILAVLYGFMMGGMLVGRLMLGSRSSVSWFEILAVVIVGGGTVIGACYSFSQESKEKEEIDDFKYVESPSILEDTMAIPEEEMDIIDDYGETLDADIEKQLEDIYVPMFQETRGMSLPQAKSTFRDLLEKAIEEIREEGVPDLPENFGDVLLEKESTSEHTRSFLEKRRKEGVKDQDIRWWWNMHDLERGMIFQVDALDRFAFFLNLTEEDGLSSDEAAKRVRKFHPIYGDPDDTSVTTGEDRPLMPELRDRVNTYVMKKNQADPEKFKQDIEESSTFNALIRNEIKKGNI